MQEKRRLVVTHVFAIFGLGLLCALWVALQLWAGEKAPGADGQCGACAHEKSDCSSSTPESPDNSDQCKKRRA